MKMRTFKVWLRGAIQPVIITAKDHVVGEDGDLVFRVGFLSLTDVARFKSHVWEFCYPTSEENL